MCVAISLDPGSELTLEEVEKMNRSNADGVGVSWANDGTVYWYKTVKVNPNYITRMIAHWKDVPRLVHFRLATAGGVHPELCHPFEIAPGANYAPVGKGQRVMIHNGHWSRWTDVAELMRKEGGLPRGPWSDTRLAAHLAWQNEEWLDTLGGKVATMDGAGNKVIMGSWDKLRDGILVSNTHWNHDFKYSRSGKDRWWEGWGREETEWEEKERHEQEKKEKAAAAAEGPKESKKGKNGKAEKSESVAHGSGVKPGRVGSDTLTHDAATGRDGLGQSDYSDHYWKEGDGQTITAAGLNKLAKIPTLGADDIGARKRGTLSLSQERGKNEWVFDHSVFRSYFTGQFFRVVPGTHGKLEYLYPHEALRLVEQATPAPSSPE